MAPPLKLGIVGFSAGNGHPFSWSAIFNGFDAQAMSSLCPYPVIFPYLSKQTYPKDFLSEKARVVGILDWEEGSSSLLASHVAESSCIETVFNTPEEMIKSVDAVLIARDDGQTHLEIATPFLEAGLPVFIDKPLALSEETVQQLYKKQVYRGQIFSASALRFASELVLEDSFYTTGKKGKGGGLLRIEAQTPKYWETYGMHLIDPIWSWLSRHFGEESLILPSLLDVQKKDFEVTDGFTSHQVVYRFRDGLEVSLTARGLDPSASLSYFVQPKDPTVGTFTFGTLDTFQCFKKSLDFFVQTLLEGNNFENEETRQKGTVSFLELGK